MSRIQVDVKALSDTRFQRLARYLGLSGGHDHALGKMIRIWWLCTDRGTYVLDPEDIGICMSVDASDDEVVDALVRAKLAHKNTIGKVRICGTKGRVEWLTRCREGGSKGGKKRRKRKTRGASRGASSPPVKGSGVVIGTGTGTGSDLPEGGPGDVQEPGSSPAGSGSEDRIQDLDFEGVAARYPRGPIGGGVYVLRHEIKTHNDFDLFEDAVEQMAEAWEGRNTTYCLGFDRFVREKVWREDKLPFPSEPADDPMVGSLEPKENADYDGDEAAPWAQTGGDDER